MVPMEGEVPFEDLDLPEPKRRRPVKVQADTGRAHFKRHKVKDPEKCDECVQAMINGGKMRAPSRATYIVTIEGLEQMLCFEHTNELRSRLGYAALRRD